MDKQQFVLFGDLFKCRLRAFKRGEEEVDFYWWEVIVKTLSPQNEFLESLTSNYVRKTVTASFVAESSQDLQVDAERGSSIEEATCVQKTNTACEQANT